MEAVIKDHFLTNILGFEVLNVDRELYSLPVRYGGLGVCNPTATAELFYSHSRKASDVMVQCNKNGEIVFEVDVHNSWCAQVHDEYLQQKKALHMNLFEILLLQYDTIHQQAILRAKSGKVSGWLTALPLRKCQFYFPCKFWDAVAIRYKKTLLNVADLCDGCGLPFTLEHALSCRKGG